MPGVMDRTNWWGNLDGNCDDILARLVEQFPVGCQVAISATVGTWNHELSIEKVEKIEKVADNHIVFLTDRYVRGFHGVERIHFEDDYRGKRFSTKKTNGFGEPIHWIILLVEPS